MYSLFNANVGNKKAPQFKIRKGRSYQKRHDSYYCTGRP